MSSTDSIYLIFATTIRSAVKERKLTKKKGSLTADAKPKPNDSDAWTTLPLTLECESL